MKTRFDIKDENVLEVDLVDSLSKLDEIVSEWDELLIESQQRSPMLSYAWVTSYIQHRLDDSQGWFVALARVNNRLVGVLPIIVTPKKVLGVNRPLLSSPNDNHTLGGDILLAENISVEVMQCIIRSVERYSSGYSVLKLSRVVERSPTASKWPVVGSLRSVKKFNGIGYYYPVSGDFDEYFSSFSKKHRGNIRRAFSNLDKQSPLKFSIVNDKEFNSDSFEEFIDLEASGWKGREGSAIKCSKELMGFYQTLSKKLARSGFLRWEFLRNESGITLAANLSIQFGSTVTIWKLAYDEEYNRFSPGSQLFKMLLEEGYNNADIDEFNLMSDTKWQKSWHPKVNQYSDLLIYSKNPFVFLLCCVPEKIKQIIKDNESLLKLARKIKVLINRR